MAEESFNALARPLPDGTVPEPIVVRTEKHWVTIMASLIGLILAIIVLTGITNALHPPSNVEVVDPLTVHLNGEFVESNLGAAREPDGSVTVRLVAVQFDFVPRCVRVPADTPIRFRLTSADVVHGFLLPVTNVNTMVVPGFVAEVRTRFKSPGEYDMPCHEFCGMGHHGMIAHVSVIPKEKFPDSGFLERTDCAGE